MKKTIEELLSGNFRHEHPQLLFSQDKIEVTLKAGDVYKGELYFGTEDNQKIRGFVSPQTLENISCHFLFRQRKQN